MRLVLLSLAVLGTALAAFAQDVAIDTAAVVPDDEHLAQIMEAGQLAGEIQACELDWQSYYLAYMQAERQRATNEGRDPDSEEYQQRIAFIGVFFGATQGRARQQFQDRPCPDDHLPELAERAHGILDAAQARAEGARDDG